MIKTTIDDSPLRGFKLVRAGHANGSYDPCAGIEWQPPRDSDELFEALRNAFPERKTHRERMCEALVEFLAGELGAKDKNELGKETTMKMVEQVGSGEVAKKSLLMSKKPLFRAHVFPSTAKTGVDSKAGEAIGTMATATAVKIRDWDDMTVVWKSDVGFTKGARPRRMMNEDERADYRMRRVRGACVACKRKKRKVACLLSSTQSIY